MPDGGTPDRAAQQGTGDLPPRPGPRPVPEGIPINAWHPDAPFAAAALAEAEIRGLRQIYESSNYVFLAELEHPEHGAGLGIYKPARGETPLSDFPPGTIHRREVAAYLCSEALGWGLIPPTVLREGPHGPGSMQLFVTHDPARHYFEFRETAAFREPLIRIAAFDLITNNADRKGGHVLVGPQERLWCIDNGLCFHAEEKLRTVVWDFAGEPLPVGLLDDLRGLAAALTARDVRGAAAGVDARGALGGLLDRGEIEALQARIAALIADPVLPEMYPWRCVPWPLV